MKKKTPPKRTTLTMRVVKLEIGQKSANRHLTERVDVIERGASDWYQTRNRGPDLIKRLDGYERRATAAIPALHSRVDQLVKRVSGLELSHPRYVEDGADHKCPAAGQLADLRRGIDFVLGQSHANDDIRRLAEFAVAAGQAEGKAEEARRHHQPFSLARLFGRGQLRG